MLQHVDAEVEVLVIERKLGTTQPGIPKPLLGEFVAFPFFQRLFKTESSSLKLVVIRIRLGRTKDFLSSMAQFDTREAVLVDFDCLGQTFDRLDWRPVAEP